MQNSNNKAAEFKVIKTKTAAVVTQGNKIYHILFFCYLIGFCLYERIYCIVCMYKHTILVYIAVDSIYVECGYVRLAGM